jgi:hypothetical protein
MVSNKIISRSSNGGNGDASSPEATIKLERNTYNKLKAIVKKQDKEVKNTVKCIIRNYVNREELFERYSPLLYIVTVKDCSMFIKDDKLNELVEVILRYKDSKSNLIEIFCHGCKTDYCVHVAFAVASNELGQLDLKILKNQK